MGGARQSQPLRVDELHRHRRCQPARSTRTDRTGLGLGDLRATRRSPGASAIIVDGHNLEEIDRALTAARQATTTPTVILARTIKGRGLSEIEDQEGWHGKALPPEMAQRALAELGNIDDVTIIGPKPAPRQPSPPSPLGGETNGQRRPHYALGDKVATLADLEAVLRQHGHANPDRIHLAILEAKGAISVLETEAAAIRTGAGIPRGAISGALSDEP